MVASQHHKETGLEHFLPCCAGTELGKGSGGSSAEPPPTPPPPVSTTTVKLWHKRAVTSAAAPGQSRKEAGE